MASGVWMKMFTGKTVLIFLGIEAIQSIIEVFEIVY